LTFNTLGEVKETMDHIQIMRSSQSKSLMIP